MGAFWKPKKTNEAGPRFEPTIGRTVTVLGLLLLLMAVVAGCSIATDLPATTTTPVHTSATAALPTTSTIAAPTTTLAESTTTTAEVTSTTLSPTTTSTVAASTSTTQTAAASEQPAGTVLYEISDWSSGSSGWAAAGQWKTAAGMLVTDGTSDSFAVAPVDLTGHPDYAVEAEVQIVDPKAQTDVLLMGRMINGTGYYGGFDGSAMRMVVGYDTTELAHSNFVLDGNWHKYRLEVRGNNIKLFFEQAEVARTTDNRELEPGTVGIYCAHGQINVRSFRVVAL